MPLTQRELDEYREVFDIFDQDKGGTIDKLELSNVLLEFGFQLSDDELDEIMNKYDPGGKNGGITFDDFVKMLQESHAAGKEADSLTKSNVPALKREIKKSFEEKAKEVIKTCGAQIESEVGEKAVKAIKSDTAKSFFRQELGKANTLILEQIQTSFNELIHRVESILDKEGARHMAGVKAVRAKCFKDSAERVMKFKRMQREAAASSKESQEMLRMKSFKLAEDAEKVKRDLQSKEKNVDGLNDKLLVMEERNEELREQNRSLTMDLKKLQSVHDRTKTQLDDLRDDLEQRKRDHKKEMRELQSQREQEAQLGQGQQQEALTEVTNLKAMVAKLQQTKLAFNATLMDQRVPNPKKSDVDENCDPILLVSRKYDIAMEQLDVERKDKAALTREKKASKNWSDYSKPAKKQIEELEAQVQGLRQEVVDAKTRIAEAGHAPIEKAAVRRPAGLGGAGGRGGPQPPLDSPSSKSEASPRNRGAGIGGGGDERRRQQRSSNAGRQQAAGDKRAMGRIASGAAAKAMGRR